MPLPTSAPFLDRELPLKYALPKVWSQESRPFGIYWSDELSIGRLWPEVSDDELRAFHSIQGAREYMGAALRKDTRKQSLLSHLAVKVAWLNDHGIVNPASTILSMMPRPFELCDIGCGVGWFLSHMRHLGATVTGVDPNPLCAELLAEQGIEFYPGTAEALPTLMSGRRFDVVTLLHSLACCRDPLLAVGNALSLLKPDGVLVLETSNMDCLGFRKYGPAWWHTDAGRNLYFFTQKSLTKIVELNSGKPIKCEYRGFVTQFTPSWTNTMARVWDGIFQGATTDVPRPTLLNSLSYMPKALLAGKRRKYECVRLYAKLS